VREIPTVFGWLQWKEYSSVEQYERKGCRWWHKQRKRRKIEEFERDRQSLKIIMLNLQSV
jgi:hypothetical protein